MEPMKKRSSSNMYELFCVTELKPIKDIKDNENKDNKEGNNKIPSTGNPNSLSNFLNSQNPNSTPSTNFGVIDYQNKSQIIKGDFYTDPEVIKKKL